MSVVDIADYVDRGYVFADLKPRVSRKLWEELRVRDAIGWREHGKPLTIHNGMDTPRELREELLDALVYCHKMKMEGQSTLLLWWALRLALWLTPREP